MFFLVSFPPTRQAWQQRQGNPSVCVDGKLESSLLGVCMLPTLPLAVGRQPARIVNLRRSQWSAQLTSRRRASLATAPATRQLWNLLRSIGRQQRLVCQSGAGAAAAVSIKPLARYWVVALQSRLWLAPSSPNGVSSSCLWLPLPAPLTCSYH